jgi:tRNA dimethylallyltransferase
MNKLLVIVGPTSSGKSELAVKLAKLFRGEIISADSRQIYKGMDLGTGKVPGKWLAKSMSLLHGRAKVTWIFLDREKHSLFVYKNIAHHLIDFVNPKSQYSVSLFQRGAKKIIEDILQRGKLPIICGGTAQWINAVVYNQQLPDVKPNLKLREQLEKKSVDVLYNRLKNLDPNRAANIDRRNKRRLIRALEIIMATGKPVPTIHYPLSTTHFVPLWLGIKTNQADLYKKIDKRLKQRLKAGMIKEVERLHSGSSLKSEVLNLKSSNGLSWKKLQSFGLEYKYISLYLQKKLSYHEMLTQLSFAIKHYSKRQMTWWKKNKEIKWIGDFKKTQKLVEKFLK